MITMIRNDAAWLLMAGAALFVLPGCGGSPSSQSKSSVSFVDQVAAAQKESVPEIRAKKLIRIGYQQAKAQDEFGAEETFDLAAKACRQVEDPTTRAGALVLMVQARLKLGNEAPARKALQSAQEAADEIESPQSKARTQARLAQLQHAIGDRAVAVQTLKAAEQLADQLTDADGNADPFGRAILLGAVVAQLIESFPSFRNTARSVKHLEKLIFEC